MLQSEYFNCHGTVKCNYICKFQKLLREPYCGAVLGLKNNLLCITKTLFVDRRFFLSLL